MEEILQKILAGQQAMQKDIQNLKDESVRAREQQILFENSMLQDMKAIKETQLIALEKWNECKNIMERVDMLLDDIESERVAVDAKIIDHETRITNLEHAS